MYVYIYFTHITLYCIATHYVILHYYIFYCIALEAPERAERRALAPALGAKYYTQEITKVKSTMIWMRIHWTMTLNIHDDVRGVDFWCAIFCPSGISRIRFIHSSNQTPCSSNMVSCCFLVVRGMSRQYPLTVFLESPTINSFMHLCMYSAQSHFGRPCGRR